MDPTYRQAVIDHFIKNFRQTNDPYHFAKMRRGEIDQLFRALNDEGKTERPDSDVTRAQQWALDKLNGKADPVEIENLDPKKWGG